MPGAQGYRGRQCRLRYRYGTVEKLLSLGNYPDVSPKRAREKRDEARRLLAALRKIEARGHHETAHRAKQKCGQVFRYAIATGRAERDISADLRGALVPVVPRNHASLTDPAEVGALLRAIDGYEGQPITAAALKLAPLVFVRPGELRGARWSEFDLDGAEWRIPAERMKMGEQHIVPLARRHAGRRLHTTLEESRGFQRAVGLCRVCARSWGGYCGLRSTEISSPTSIPIADCITSFVWGVEYGSSAGKLIQHGQRDR
jgi:integrase